MKFILLLARGGQEADHLHRQLQPLKVVFQILSFHCEAVLPVSGGDTREKETESVKTYGKTRACLNSLSKCNIVIILVSI